MKFRALSVSAAAVVAVAASTVVGVSPAQAVSWSNCDSVHRTYPHGVGRVHAHDDTSGTPVRNFKHSNRLYRIAMNHNRGLDGDGDKIACEAA